MPVVAASVEVAPSDQFRIRPRQGGGFHLLVGEPGQHCAKFTFTDVGTAEKLAETLTLAALAATHPAPSNVTRFPARAATPTDNPPLDAA